MSQASGVATLGTFYRNWEEYQDQLIAAIEPLTEEQLSLRASPKLRPIWKLAAHIIGARARWMNKLLGEGGPEVARLAGWDRRGARPRGAEELATGLRTTWECIRSALDRWTPEDMAQTYTEHEDGEDFTFSRAWIVWHLIEHDVHHGGELSYSLGMHRLPGIEL